MADPVLVVRVAANITELRKNLLEGTSTIETTKSAMTSMANSFDGSRIIAQSGAVMAQIDALGGVSKLTAAEQSKANRILEEALDKYKLLGKEAPPGMQALAVSTRGANNEVEKLAPKTNTLTGSFQKFDGVLSSVGVNISPYVKGLVDIGEASGKTVTSMGLLGTAGLAAGAMFAGWNIGRWIADVFDLDKKVAGLATSLLGLGNVSAETAAAKLDTINLAIRNGARETISYTEAIQYNIDAVKRNADAKINWRERLSDAYRELRNLTDAQKEEIRIAIEAGAKTEELTNQYHIGAAGLKLLAERDRDAAAAKKEHEAATRSLNAAYDKLMSETKNANQLAIMEKDAADMSTAAINRKWTAGRGWYDQLMSNVKATNDQKAAEAEMLKQQGDGLTIIGQSTAAHAAAGAAAKSGGDATVAAYAGVAQQVTLTGDAIKEYINLMRYAAQVNAVLQQPGTGLFTTQSQRERIASLPSFATGVTNFEGGVARVHRDELLVNLPRGTDVIPAAAQSSSGGARVVELKPVLNFYGPVGTDDFETMVSRALLNVFRSGAIPIPANG